MKLNTQKAEIICICAKRNVCNVLGDGSQSSLCQIISDLLFSHKKTRGPPIFGDVFTNLHLLVESADVFA